MDNYKISVKRCASRKKDKGPRDKFLCKNNLKNY